MHENPPWWESPLRIIDYVYTSEIDTIDMAAYTRFCQKMHANVVHFHCMDCSNGGVDEEKLYFRCQHARRTHRDLLAEGIPLLHDAGIKVVVYFDGHWFPAAFLDAHPNWQVLREDGSRVGEFYGSDDATTCVNSPWRDWSYEVITDILAYDVDGIFFDGPLTYLGAGGCYCATCKTLFRRRYDRDMPSIDRTQGEDWRLLHDFALVSLREFYHDAYRLIKGLRPEAAVYLNAGNVGEPGWLRGRANRGLMPYQDLLISEGGFHYGRIAPHQFKTGASSRLYETQAGGKPCANAVAPAFGMYRPHLLSRSELQITISEASFGAGVYCGFFSESRLSPNLTAVEETYGFLEAHEELYRATRSAANVALLYSSQTIDHYAGVDIPYCDISGMRGEDAAAIGNFSRSFYGFYEMLQRLRIPFDVLDEPALAGDLSRYRAIVLPNCACLSDADCTALRSYAEAGGVLVADFETGFCDATGARRDTPGLLELFGVERTDRHYRHRRFDMVFLDEAVRHFAGRLQDAFVPATPYNIRCTPAGGQALGAYSETLVSNITSKYAPSSEPFLVEHAIGSGRCFYFPGTFGEFYQQMHLVPYQDLLGDILATAGAPAIRIEGDPHLLNVSVRTQPGRRLLHLVNHELGNAVESIPARHLAISLTGVDHPGRVRALKLGEDLPASVQAGWLSFILPRLDEYELIVVEEPDR